MSGDFKQGMHRIHNQRNVAFLPLFVRYGPPGPEPLLTAGPRAVKDYVAFHAFKIILETLPWTETGTVRVLINP